MKSSNVFRNLLVMGIFLVGGISITTAQTTSTTTNQTQVTGQHQTGKVVENSPSLPADFPKYVDTGNAEADAANYSAAKEKWISENREVYDAYLKSQGVKSSSTQPKTIMATKPSTETNNPEKK